MGRQDNTDEAGKISDMLVDLSVIFDKGNIKSSESDGRALHVTKLVSWTRGTESYNQNSDGELVS